MAAQDHYLTTVDWRWTGAGVTIFQLSPTIVFAVPAILISSIDMTVIICCVIYFAFCVWLAIRTYHGSMVMWLRSLRTRYIQRCEWIVR